MIFASLGNFSNNVESALIPCYDLNIDKYIQKSKKIFDWVEIMEYPPHIFTCQKVVISYYLRQRMPQD